METQLKFYPANFTPCDKEHSQRRSSSSILKPSKSPRIPLQDIMFCENEPDERRKSQLTRRVSFAEKHEIKEYAVADNSENSESVQERIEAAYTSSRECTDPEVYANSPLKMFSPSKLRQISPVSSVDETSPSQMEKSFFCIDDDMEMTCQAMYLSSVQNQEKEDLLENSRKQMESNSSAVFSVVTQGEGKLFSVSGTTLPSHIRVAVNGNGDEILHAEYKTVVFDEDYMEMTENITGLNIIDTNGFPQEKAIEKTAERQTVVFDEDYMEMTENITGLNIIDANGFSQEKAIEKTAERQTVMFDEDYMEMTENITGLNIIDANGFPQEKAIEKTAERVTVVFGEDFMEITENITGLNIIDGKCFHQGKAIEKNSEGVTENISNISSGFPVHRSLSSSKTDDHSMLGKEMHAVGIVHSMQSLYQKEPQNIGITTNVSTEMHDPAPHEQIWLPCLIENVEESGERMNVCSHGHSIEPPVQKTIAPDNKNTNSHESTSSSPITSANYKLSGNDQELDLITPGDILKEVDDDDDVFHSGQQVGCCDEKEKNNTSEMYHSQLAVFSRVNHHLRITSEIPKSLIVPKLRRAQVSSDSVCNIKKCKENPPRKFCLRSGASKSSLLFAKNPQLPSINLYKIASSDHLNGSTQPVELSANLTVMNPKYTENSTAESSVVTTTRRRSGRLGSLRSMLNAPKCISEKVTEHGDCLARTARDNDQVPLIATKELTHSISKTSRSKRDQKFPERVISDELTSYSDNSKKPIGPENNASFNVDLVKDNTIVENYSLHSVMDQFNYQGKVDATKKSLIPSKTDVNENLTKQPLGHNTELLLESSSTIISEHTVREKEVPLVENVKSSVEAPKPNTGCDVSAYLLQPILSLEVTEIEAGCCPENNTVDVGHELPNKKIDSSIHCLRVCDENRKVQDIFDYTKNSSVIEGNFEESSIKYVVSHAEPEETVCLEILTEEKSFVIDKAECETDGGRTNHGESHLSGSFDNHATLSKVPHQSAEEGACSDKAKDLGTSEQHGLFQNKICGIELSQTNIGLNNNLINTVGNDCHTQKESLDVSPSKQSFVNLLQESVTQHERSIETARGDLSNASISLNTNSDSLLGTNLDESCTKNDLPCSEMRHNLSNLLETNESLYKTFLYRDIFLIDENQSYWEVILAEPSRIVFLFLKCIYFVVVLEDDLGTSGFKEGKQTIQKGIKDLKIKIAKREGFMLIPTDEEVVREIAFQLVWLNLDLDRMKECYNGSEKITQILKDVSNIAYRARAFIRDIGALYFHCTPKISHADAKTEVIVEFFSVILEITFTLTFIIDLTTYPFGVVKPIYEVIGSSTLNMKALVVDTAMNEKTGDNYLTRMVSAVWQMLYVEAGKRKKENHIYNKWCF